MAKTLIIKGADFSTNKLDTVAFGNVPCTGISIDSTASVQLNGTTTLVPTLTPENTTDTVTWLSSDPTVASVSGGVVTAHAYGTATITATCGEYSDTCVVTIAISMLYAKNWMSQLQIVSNELKDVILGSELTNNRNIVVGAEQETGTYPVSCSVDTGDYGAIYPIAIPEGATTITVEHTDFASLIIYYNLNEKSTLETASRVRDSAKVLDGETATSGTNWSIASWTFDERVYTIPIGEGINSFSLLLYTTNSTAYGNLDPSSSITITFGFD